MTKKVEFVNSGKISRHNKILVFLSFMLFKPYISATKIAF